jgi:hypothetical protein
MKVALTPITLRHVARIFKGGGGVDKLVVRGAKSRL